MIALITPTGTRPFQMGLCAKFMLAQKFIGDVTWIIVDDGLPRTTNFIPEDFRKNWTIIKVYPEPAWKDGDNTQGRNMQAGLDEVKKLNNVHAVFVIEDDDYYCPEYLGRTLWNLSGFDLVGEKRTVYYNVRAKGWFINENRKHSSLCQTAFLPSVIPVVERIIKERAKFIDIRLFKQPGLKINLFKEKPLSIGIKGLPGRDGIGGGHKTKGYIPDHHFTKLKELTGEDYKYYEAWSAQNTKG